MLGIIVLNYREWKLSVDCIKSIRKTITDIDYKIYLIEGGSGNDSKVELTNRYKDDTDIKIVILQENRGFAYGNNRGADVAIGEGCDQLLIVNSDVLFEKNAINELKAFLDNNQNVKLVSPFVYNYGDANESLLYIKHRRTNGFEELFLRMSLLQKIQYVKLHLFTPIRIDDKPRRQYWFDGCCFMVNSEAYKKVGMLDETTFLYYEEDILSEKMYQHGMEMYLIPSSRIVHLGGGSTSNVINIKLELSGIKSRMYYMRKYRRMPRIVLTTFVRIKLLALMNKCSDTTFNSYREEVNQIFDVIRYY